MAVKGTTLKRLSESFDFKNGVASVPASNYFASSPRYIAGVAQPSFINGNIYVVNIGLDGSNIKITLSGSGASTYTGAAWVTATLFATE